MIPKETVQKMVGAATADRRRATKRPVNEDFQPQSEFKQEGGAHILLLSLPGFNKNEVKVTVDKITNIVTIEGRRFLGNKWSRFKKAFPVPQSSKPELIRAKFQNEKLIVTFPLKDVPPASQQPQPKQKAQPTQWEDIPAPAAQVKPKEIAEAPPPLGPAHKQQAVESVPSGPESGPSTQKDVVDHPRAAEKKPNGLTAGPSNQNDLVEKAARLEGAEKQQKDEGPAPLKDEHKMEERNAVAAAAAMAAADAKAAATNETAAATMARTPTQEEDKRLLLNVGAAVLVIVALGTYISYGFWSRNNGS